MALVKLREAKVASFFSITDMFMTFITRSGDFCVDNNDSNRTNHYALAHARGNKNNLRMQWSQSKQKQLEHSNHKNVHCMSRRLHYVRIWQAKSNKIQTYNVIFTYVLTITLNPTLPYSQPYVYNSTYVCMFEFW